MYYIKNRHIKQLEVQKRLSNLGFMDLKLLYTK
jgi:hypothetical protein